MNYLCVLFVGTICIYRLYGLYVVTCRYYMYVLSVYIAYMDYTLLLVGTIYRYYLNVLSVYVAYMDFMYVLPVGTIVRYYI